MPLDFLAFPLTSKLKKRHNLSTAKASQTRQSEKVCDISIDSVTGTGVIGWGEMELNPVEVKIKSNLN